MLTIQNTIPAVSQYANQDIGTVHTTKRNRGRERRLWHEPELKMASLGCCACPDKHMCGGLRMRAAFFDCLQFCCGEPKNCDRVCRNNPDFANRMREVGTFDLGNISHAPKLPFPSLPFMIPVFYNGSSRNVPVTCGVAALPLFKLLNRRTGALRFTSQEELCAEFCLNPDTTIMLTGIDRDEPIEYWWGLTETRRISIIRAMKAAGIAMVTVPNFSLFTDRPRQDNLHSIKRIGIVYEEFLREGVPAALHTNGRTETDFARWADFIIDRPEVTHLAYEFTTGTGWVGRQNQHAEWLAELAGAVKRPLHLIVRGGIDVLPILKDAFAGVSLLETSIFIKTMKRKRAYLKNNAELDWKSAPTEVGAPLDELFAANRDTVESWLCAQYAAQLPGARLTG